MPSYFLASPNSDLGLEVWVAVSIGWWLSIHETIGYTDNINLSDWFLLAYPDKDYRKWVIEKWNADVEKALKEGKENEYFQDVMI